MARPKLFFGTRNLNAFLEANRGYLDRSVNYDLYAKTNRYAPAGAGGEAIFTSLYAVVTHTATMTLYITPILDGTALETQQIALVQNAQAARQTRAFELGLSVPVLVGGVEKGRVSPRGTWLQVLVETRFATNGQTPAQVLIDGLEMEYQVVRESQQPGVAR